MLTHLLNVAKTTTVAAVAAAAVPQFLIDY